MLVPMSEFSSLGKSSVDAPGAVPPRTRGGRSLRVRSCAVLYGESDRMMHDQVVCCALPIHENLRASNCTPSAPVTWLTIWSSLNAPSVSPSGLSTLKRWLAANRLPAPSMFSTTTVGLPGMWEPRYLDSTRAVVSYPPPGA